MLRELKKTAGEKTVVVVSGGWPLELRESGSELAPLASLAADAQVTIFTLYAESAEGSAERRSMSTTMLADQTVRRWPLQTIAGMTGGNSYRADIGAASVFDRLGRELSGYTGSGSSRMPPTSIAKPRPMKVDVARRGTTVRARERFVVPSYADRDNPARLEEALISPIPSTGVGLRLTSYLAADPDAPSRVKVLLVGDAFRLQPGEVNLQVVLRDATGKALSSGGRSIGEATTDRLPFTTSLTLDPGRYAARVAVMDAAGMVGSVDHVLDVRRTTLGAWSAGDLLLGKVPATSGGEAGFLLDGVRQDERLALQLNLVGDRVAESDVVFEIAASDDAPSLLTLEASHASGGSRVTR